MTPTNKLRFVEREIHVTVEPMFNITTGKTIRILQQWWAVKRDEQITPTGEWRDVPVEVEA
jgi:hypothetical protein